MLLPNIHILGIQGSGKGTQSALLVERYGLNYISSGDLFRARAQVEDSFGKELRQEMAAGRLLHNETLFQTVEDYLVSEQPQNGLLADGVIRTVEQYEGLEPTWPKHELDEPLLIHFILSEDTAMERIAQRQKEQNDPNRHEHYLKYGGKLLKRNDDNPAAILERFRLFHAMTEPVIWVFDHENRCVHIEANRPVEAIQADIHLAIEQYYPTLSHVSH